MIKQRNRKINKYVRTKAIAVQKKVQMFVEVESYHKEASPLAETIIHINHELVGNLTKGTNNTKPPTLEAAISEKILQERKAWVRM